MRRALWLSSILLVTWLAGCSAPTESPLDGPSDDGSPATGEAGRSRTVVAVLEGGGTNPYHVDFREPGQTAHPAAYITGYPTDATPLHLSLDAPDYASAVDNDTDVWDQARQLRENASEPTVHYVPGTNIVAMVDLGAGLLDPGGHQTGTTSLATGNVNGMAPDADLVVISGDLFAGMQWAAEQEWIDVISISLGAFLGPCVAVSQWCDLPLDVCTGNPFLPVSFVRHTRAFHDRGGAVFGAAGYGCGSHVADVGSSYPGNTLTSFFSGPSWVVTVGTFGEEERQGEWDAAYPVDILSSSGPYPAAAKDHQNQTVEFGHASGAIPRAAGVYAALLQHARELLGDTDEAHGGDVLARGEPLPAGPLDDGILTVAEMEAVYFHAAVPVDALTSAQQSRDPVEWARSVMPAPPEAEFLTQGYGLVDNATLTAGQSYLEGSPMPDRTREDVWRLAVDTSRDAVWATVDDNDLYVI